MDGIVEKWKVIFNIRGMKIDFQFLFCFLLRRSDILFLPFFPRGLIHSFSQDNMQAVHHSKGQC